MNIKELGEELEQQLGKPRNITEENVRFMLSIVKEKYDGKKVNEDVENTSLDAFAMTILAVMYYQTTPWEDLSKVFAINHAALSYFCRIKGAEKAKIRRKTTEIRSVTKKIANFVEIWRYGDRIIR